jgi:hypothetical protein
MCCVQQVNGIRNDTGTAFARCSGWKCYRAGRLVAEDYATVMIPHVVYTPMDVAPVSILRLIINTLPYVLFLFFFRIQNLLITHTLGAVY